MVHRKLERLKERPKGKRMLKIDGAPHSRAFRVIWLANEIGIPHEHIPVTFDPPNLQCKEPWYVALNPNGRVPSIDDDGFVMVGICGDQPLPRREV